MTRIASVLEISVAGVREYPSTQNSTPYESPCDKAGGLVLTRLLTACKVDSAYPTGCIVETSSGMSILISVPRPVRLSICK